MHDDLEDFKSDLSRPFRNEKPCFDMGFWEGRFNRMQLLRDQNLYVRLQNDLVEHTWSMRGEQNIVIAEGQFDNAQ